MRALVLGCGQMGREAVNDLHHYAAVDEIVVGTRHPERVEEFIASLGHSGPRVTQARVDANSGPELAALMRRADVVVNCAGPNYRYEVIVARAAIETRVNLVDLNDEYATTQEMFTLDADARRAGVTVILGLGGSPGVNNIFVRAAANQLDAVEEIHTAWAMSALDPGGPALAAHLLCSLSQHALTVQNGRLVEVESFVDGRETIDFPAPVGALDTWHVGHPEPLMLSRSFPEAKTIANKATFNPPEVNGVIRSLGARVRELGGPVSGERRSIDAMESAAAEFLCRCKGVNHVPAEAALQVMVQGRKKGRLVKIFFSSAAMLAPATGIPASIGAMMLLHGSITAKGVLPPEQCVDPTDFIYEIITRRNVAKLNGWVED
jgi:saccharopine dehydrogenase-like NADP-dependent oxidoreductase